MAFAFNPFTGQLDLVGTQSNGGSVDSNIVLETITLDSTQVSAKQVSLQNTPVTPNKTMLDIVGGCSQRYGIDFIISGQILDWNNLALDLTLSVGDTIRIYYII